MTALSRSLPSRLTGRRASVLAEIVLGGALLLYPLVDQSLVNLGRLQLAFVYLMAALALNFVFGYGGELAIGQPAMLTAAGYVAGLLSAQRDWPFWYTTLAAIAVCIVLSVFMGLPGLRVQGWYLGVLGFLGVAIVPNIINAFRSSTGGTDGLAGIQPIRFHDTGLPAPWVAYECILIATIVFWIAGNNLIRSGWGTTLLAQRDYPHAAVASGVNVLRLRAAVYILSGIPCGVAGALYAHSQQFISASNFDTQTVLLLLGSVLLGGRGRRWGPVLGVAIFAGISLGLGPFNSYNPLVLGIGVVIAALLFKGGVTGAVEQVWRRRFAPKSTIARWMSSEHDGAIAIDPVDTPPKLELHGVTKRFAGVTALDDVSLTVEGGTVLTVVGANGSGKTTLLNCVSGFVTPDSGTVALNGQNIGQLPSYRRAHLGFGRTFQVPRLVEELTVRENAELGVYGLRAQSIGGSIFRTPRYRRRQREAAERARAACLAVGLSPAALQAKVEELPLAVKRIVEIARALAADASIICLDEPVAGLNVAEQAQVSATLRAVAASGRAVLLIEHNLPFVLSVSDRLVLLRNGTVVDRGTPADTNDASRPLGHYFHIFAARGNSAAAHSDQLPVEPVSQDQVQAAEGLPR